METPSRPKPSILVIILGSLLGILLAVLFIFLIIQLIPYGRDHTNPAVASEPAWDTPETRALAQRACFDCHSNETVWPWYSNIAPVSWIVARDVLKGRDVLNFSQWDEPASQAREIEEISKVVREGEMPPSFYLTMHPTARLTADEIQALADGLDKSIQP